MFDPNGPLMYAMTAIVILFVIAMSIRFIVMAWKRAKKIGMDPKVLRRVAISSAIFTIAPAVSILLGVIALSYETPAAASAASAMGTDLSNLITDPVVIAAIAWVMTLGIIPGPVLVPTIGKKIENGVMRIRQKDEHWGSLFMTALFLGMISAFLGMIFATVSEGLRGWIPCFVMIASALIMCVCAVFVKVLHWKWMEDYALPISMLGGMALSIPITNLVNMIAG